MEIIVDAFLDALIDGVKMLPFLYLAYLLIEWLERNHGERIEKRWLAAATGLCARRTAGLRTTVRIFGGSGQLLCQPGHYPGTLLAVFLATSDEAIPLLAAVVFGVMLWTMPRYKQVQAGLDRVLSATPGEPHRRAGGAGLRQGGGRDPAVRGENQALTHLQVFVGRVSALMNRPPMCSSTWPPRCSSG